MQLITNNGLSETLVGIASVVPAGLITIPILSPLFRGDGQTVARRGSILSSLGLLVSLCLLLFVCINGAISVNLFGPITLYLDRLSTLILAMVAFLGLIVTRYTINHLAGDPNQAQFVRRLLLTVASVECLTVSGNLLLFAIAWAGTSLTLHRLLIFFPERPGAKLAAKKRFLFSRMGDTCLIIVLFLVWKTFGSWDLPEIFHQVEGGKAVSHAIPILLALTALLKSAQIPFHSWLPETMESPTPVSALMHAGIVNAGGFLILRLSPIMTESVLAMDLLIIIGGGTAVCASFVMMTQTSIKRMLAWSTISQMGFMMLQCGLGAFGLAALHIVAHSLYKAHSFLSAGGIVARAAKRDIYSPPKLGQWAIGLGLALALVIGALATTGYLSHLHGSTVVLFSVLAIAISQLIASAQVRFQPKQRLKHGVGMSAIVVGIVLALHFLVEVFFHPVFHEQEVQHTFIGYLMMALVPLLLGVIIFLQSRLAKGTASARLRRIYIHAYHGFYFGTWLARLLGVKGHSRPL